MSWRIGSIYCHMIGRKLRLLIGSDQWLVRCWRICSSLRTRGPWWAESSLGWDYRLENNHSKIWLRGPAYVETASPTNQQNQWKNDVIMECSLSDKFYPTKYDQNHTCTAVNASAPGLFSFNWWLVGDAVFTYGGPLNKLTCNKLSSKYSEPA